MGLTSAEAANRLAVTGRNRLPESSRTSRFALVRHQLTGPLIGLLLLAAVVSLAIGEALDAAVIVAVVVANGALGAVQERRAEEAARAVRGLLASHARVRRAGGSWSSTPSWWCRATSSSCGP